MSHSRSAVWGYPLTSLVLVLLLGGGALATGAATGSPVAAWPPSERLLVAEVVTGGESASDEYIELYNADDSELSLDGLEVAYVSASGTTVSRKAAWDGATILGPRRHLLIANEAGIHVDAADVTYAGGLAATGGSVVLRTAAGEPIDSLSWGTASSAFVEGRPGSAPQPGSSLERLPGGSAGNGVDTNDNAADTRILPSPVPQAAGDDATPAATGSPVGTPEEGSGPTQPPAGTAPAARTSDAVPTPKPSDAAPSGNDGDQAGVPLASAEEARALPIGTAVRVLGTLTTPLASLEGGRGAFLQDETGGIALHFAEIPTDALAAGTEIEVAGTVDSRYAQSTLRVASMDDVRPLRSRALPEPEDIATGGAGEAFEARLVRVAATVTDGPDELGDGFAVTLDDGTGPLRVIATSGSGIPPADLDRSRVVTAVGVLGQRDSSGTGVAGYRLHVTSPSDVTQLQPAASPTPWPAQTFASAVPASPTPSVTALPPAPSSASPTPSLTSGATPLLPSPPAPGATAVLTAPATAAPSGPTTAPSATPGGSSPPPSSVSISVARSTPVGSVVTVVGVVTAEAGAVLDPHVVMVQDSTSGIAVRFGATPPAVARGAVLRVTGKLANPYGNLEVRPDDEADVSMLPAAALPPPLLVDAVQLHEAVEGRLVQVTGRVVHVDRASSGNLTALVADDTGQARVSLQAPVAAAAAPIQRGQHVSMTGIAGQRRTTQDAVDGYRVWPRDALDVVVLAEPNPSPTPTPRPTATPRPTLRPTSTPRPTPTPHATPSNTAPTPAAVVSIAVALQRQGATVTVEGVVTSRPGLLDTDGRRVTIQDATAAVLVRLPRDAAGVALGDRVRVTGTVARYYGAPQLGAESAPRVLAGGRPPAPLRPGPGPLVERLEWRLVQVSGRVADVKRSGTTWRAELQAAGGVLIPVVGVSRSGIPSTALTEGATAVITGLVRRPTPSAADRRFAVVPRSAADVRASAGTAGSDGSGDRGGASSRADGRGRGRAQGGSPSGGATSTPSGVVGSGASNRPGTSAGGRSPGALANGSVIDVDLREIAQNSRKLVRIGGMVVAVDGLVITLDDGTSRGAARLPRDAGALARLLRLGEPLNVTGRVVRSGSGAWQVAAAAIVDVARAGALDAPPLAEPAGSGSPPPSSSPEATDTAVLGAAPSAAHASGSTDPLVVAAALATLGLLLAGPVAWRALRRRTARDRGAPAPGLQVPVERQPVM